MLQIVIFSFNRAMQLDTLLTTLVERWKEPEFQVDVIYNTSADDYDEGYRLVMRKFHGQPVVFHKEKRTTSRPTLRELTVPDNMKRYLKQTCLRHPRSNFRELLLSVMKRDSSRFVMFMTDDSMFVGDVLVPQSVFTWIDSKSADRQFILRIGEGMNDQPEGLVSRIGSLLEWNMYQAPMLNNWGYNFSVDAHIYNKVVITELFEKLIFVNPNTLEDPVCREMRRRGMMSEARSFARPCLLSFPVNMVQTVASNESLGVDTRRLNDYYLEGYTMRYPIPEVMTHFQIYPQCLHLYKDGVMSKFQIQ